MILYHDNENGRQYDENGHLTNNWNPDGPFTDDEYVRIYFRLETESYFHSNRPYSMALMFDSSYDREAFYRKVGDALKKIGWTVEDKVHARLDKSHLYIHPQMVSGTVHKWEVKQIAEHLLGLDGIGLRYVDLYDTVYDWTDEEYQRVLDGKKPEIRKAIVEYGKTNRRSVYKQAIDIARRVAEKVMTLRVGVTDGSMRCDDMTVDFCYKIILELVDEGYMDSINQEKWILVRTINMTEQRQSGKYIKDVA